MSEEARGRGRPCVYNQEQAMLICERLADGESLRSICSAEDMPPESTVRTWVLDNREGFAAHFARARELQSERWAEEILSISDDGSNDTYTDEDGNVRTDHDVIARSKLRVDTRKWLLSKMLPKRYGEKVEHTGPEGGPIEIVTTRRIVDSVQD